MNLHVSKLTFKEFHDLGKKLHDYILSEAGKYSKIFFHAASKIFINFVKNSQNLTAATEI